MVNLLGGFDGLGGVLGGMDDVLDGRVEFWWVIGLFMRGGRLL